jgi:hypothetical protein
LDQESKETHVATEREYQDLYDRTAALRQTVIERLAPDPRQRSTLADASSYPTEWASGRREAVYDEKYMVQKRQECTQLFEGVKTAFQTLSDVQALEHATERAKETERRAKQAAQVKEDRAEQERNAVKQAAELRTEAIRKQDDEQNAKEQVAKAEQELEKAVGEAQQAQQEHDQAPTEETKAKLDKAIEARNQAAQEVTRSNERATKARDERVQAEVEASNANRDWDDAKQASTRAATGYDQAVKEADAAKADAAYLADVESDIKWFVHKCGAGVQVAGTFDPQRRATDVLAELRGLCKEIWAAWRPFKQFAKLNADRIDRCEGPLKELSLALSGLCLDLEAVKEGKPRYSFLLIKDAGSAMEKEWNALNTLMATWKGVDSSLAGTLDPVQRDVDKLLQYSNRVVVEAENAAKSCVTEDMRKSVDVLCVQFANIRTTYDDLICQLDILQCLPELQPPLLSEMRGGIARIGYYMANAMRALASIKLLERNWVEQLQQEWHAISLQVDVLAEEIKRWAQKQLCTPPDYCQAAITRLRHCVGEAWSQVATLQSDPDCREVLEQQRALIECVHAELITLSAQAESLQDQGFNYAVFDKFWWPTAHIGQILYPCPEEESPCVLTERDVEELVEELKKKRADAGRQSVDMRVPVYTRPPSYAGVLGRPAPQTARVASAGESLRRVPHYLEMWKKLETLACDLGPKVPTRLKSGITKLINQIQQEQRRLQAYRGAGDAALSRALRQMGRRWNSIHATLSAVHALTLDYASSAQRKELAEIGRQLSVLNQPITETFGYRLPISELVASDRGVCAS